MIDVSKVPGVEMGDEVTLIGLPGGTAPDGEAMAKILGTITNDVICMPTRRIPRVYIRNEEIVYVKNYLS
jgi:alanine racemase